MDDLEENEKILWQGKVNKKIYKPMLFFEIVALIISFFCTVILIIKFNLDNEETMIMLMLTLLLFLPLYIYSVLYRKSLEKRKYIITNHRIIIFLGLLTYRKSSLYFKDITGYDYIYTFLDRFETIDCASVDFASPSIHIDNRYNIASSKYIFAHIGKEEARQVLNIVKEQIKNYKNN